MGAHVSGPSDRQQPIWPPTYRDEVCRTPAASPMFEMALLGASRRDPAGSGDRKPGLGCRVLEFAEEFASRPSFLLALGERRGGRGGFAPPQIFSQLKAPQRQVCRPEAGSTAGRERSKADQGQAALAAGQMQGVRKVEPMAMHSGHSQPESYMLEMHLRGLAIRTSKARMTPRGDKPIGRTSSTHFQLKVTVIAQSRRSCHRSDALPARPALDHRGEPAPGRWCRAPAGRLMVLWAPW